MVGRGCFRGGAGGQEKATRHGQQGRSLDDTRFQTVPFCYVLYVEQWKFHYSMSSGHHEGVLDPRLPWSDTCTVSGLDNPSTYTTH